MFHDYVNTTYISTENMFFVVQMISSSHKKIATLPPSPPPPPPSPTPTKKCAKDH